LPITYFNNKIVENTRDALRNLTFKGRGFLWMNKYGITPGSTFYQEESKIECQINILPFGYKI
jgi:hypothetical protein